MVLIEDTRNKIGKHNNVFRYCKKHNIEICRKALLVGDYMLPNGKISVDTKQSIIELANDIYSDKLAFNKKYKKCLRYGIKLIVLIEENIDCLENLVSWKSNRTRISGKFLYEMMTTLKLSYGVRFVFCDKKDTGKTLIELLNE